MRHNPNTIFLGITHDRQITFGLHASFVGSMMRQQTGAMRFHASTDWGYEKSIIRSFYIATGRSKFVFATATWLSMPWVSISTMEKLEMCQRCAGRTITGQLKTTPVEVILAEADLLFVATRATQLSTMAMKNSLRMPDANPEKQIATEYVRQCTKNTRWRKKASDVWRSIFGSTQTERTPGLLPPWLQTTTFSSWMVQSQVRRRKTKYGRCRDSPRTGAHTI